LSAAEGDPRIELAERALKVLAAGDSAAAVRYMHPDVVLDWSRSRAPYHGVYEGHAGAQELIGETIAAFREIEYFADEWIPVGERLVRVGGIRGVGRASGVEFSGRGAQVYEFEGELVSRVTLYQGKEEALAAAGAD
jgi:ketosteroid isomerase-like protein